MEKKIILDLYRKTKLNLFPASGKAPVSSWRKYQNIKITEPELDAMFSLKSLKREITGIGIICGGEDKIECLDLDNKGNMASKILEKLRKLTTKEFWDSLYIESTPTGGYHIIYSCEKISGNTILARNKNNETIAETRGIGGFVVIAPTPGYTPIQGTLEKIPRISPHERALLFSICSSFDANFSLSTRTRPGDEFNQKANIEDILIPLGWKKTGGNSFVEYWLRPGKEYAPSSCSATWNPHLRKFYVFSTNIPELKENQAYDLFGLFTHLHHHGDFQKATKELLKLGYGTNGHEEKVTAKQREAFEIAVDFLKSKASFRRNLVTGLIEFKTDEDWDNLRDQHLDAWWTEFKLQGHRVPYEYFSKIISGQLATDYHPFREYFYSLPPWDGFDYIQEYLDCFETEIPEQFTNLFKKWIVGVVANALEKDSNQHCLTLVGPQGIGKTSMLRLLCPPSLSKYYAETSIPSTADKDSLLLVAENILINLDEMETSTNEEIGFLKSLITRKDIKIRRPYARYAEVLPRHASFMGSLNRNLFLNDPTGSRRFFVIPIKSISFPSNFSADGLMAQAYKMFQEGHSFTLSPEEIEEITDYNENFTLPSIELELVQKYFEPVEIPENWTPRDIQAVAWAKGWVLMTASEILQELTESASKIKLSLRMLGLNLQKLNAKQILIWDNGAKKRVYVLKRKSNSPNSSTVVQPKLTKEDEEDEEMPF